MMHPTVSDHRRTESNLQDARLALRARSTYLDNAKIHSNRPAALADRVAGLGIWDPKHEDVITGYRLSDTARRALATLPAHERMCWVAR